MSATNWSMTLPGRDDVRRILVIKWSALGDVVIASASFEDIALAFPECEIHLNTLPPWSGLFEHDSRFGEVLSIDVRDRANRWRRLREWVGEIRARRYDAIFDLQSNEHTRLLVTLLTLMGSGIRYRVGYHRRYPYNIAPLPLAPPAHVFDQARAALEASGVPTLTPRPVLCVSKAHEERALALSAGNGLEAGDYAVFLPGCQAAGYLKRWGAERFAALGKDLHAAGWKRVVLLGGPDEAEECRRIERACGPWLVNLCGQTRLAELIPLCARARIVVANDTGTAHIAAAAARPIVVICGPTDPRRVKPIGPDVATLQADIPCINCYRKHCAHHSCMRHVTPGEVRNRIEQLLRSIAGSPGAPAGSSA